MWTCLIVVLHEDPAVPIASRGLIRAGEVLLGAATGYAFHRASELGIAALENVSPAWRLALARPAQPHASHPSEGND